MTSRENLQRINEAIKAAKHLIKHPHSKSAWGSLDYNTLPIGNYSSKGFTCPISCDNCPLALGITPLNLPEFICEGNAHDIIMEKQIMGEVILLLIQFVATMEVVQEDIKRGQGGTT